MTASSLLHAWLRQEDPASSLPRILLLDGGVSTHLEQQADFPVRELWSSSLLLTVAGRDVVRQGHASWLQSCNVITTCTYQLHFMQHLLPYKLNMAQSYEHGRQVAQQAVEEHHHQCRSVQQRPRRPVFVVLSCGSYGGCLANGAEYTGDYGSDISVATLQSFWQPRLAQQGNLHGVGIETIPSLLEVQALVDLLPRLPASSCRVCWISLACRDEWRLNDGTPLPVALDELAKLPTRLCPALGLNCCKLLHMPALVRSLVQHMANQQDNNNAHDNCGRGIVLYPNAGEDWQSSTQTWLAAPGLPTTAMDRAAALFDLIRIVETMWHEHAWRSNTVPPMPRILVGGCCRTTPEDLAALRTLVDQHLAAHK